MEENTEFVTSLHGDVFQRIPGEKNLWTLIQGNHSFGSALGERFHRVKRSGTDTDTALSAVQKGRQWMTMPTRIQTLAV